MLLTVHGARAYCYTGGKAFDAALPTAVFIHGAQNDHSVWILQTRYFAHHGFNVLAVDLPGHGRSGGAALSSVAAMAAWLIALLDAAQVAHALLIGHSMGSLIALETARVAPDRTSAVALLGTAFPMKVSTTLLEAALHDEASAIRMVNIWSHSSIAQKPSCPGPGFYAPNGAARLKERITALNPAQVFHTDFTACDAYDTGLEAAQTLRCPALFVLAERDVMTPAKAAQALITAVPHAEVARIARSGHEMMAEQPDRVLDALFAFAARLPRA